MASPKTGILKALLYADIFDFPLTKEELMVFAVEEKITSDKEIEKALDALRVSVVAKEGYYCLKGREKNIQYRVERKKCSEKKLDLARTLSLYMTFVPSVLFVGVTGGVAAGNAEKDDDIDFLIITSEGTLWTTRLMLLTILQLLGRRRGRSAHVVSDMACLNFFLDASGLSMPESMRSMYTAHEIVQMQPVFSRGDTYDVFLQKNDWIYTYLPQAKKKIEQYIYRKKPLRQSAFSRLLSKKAVVQLSTFLQRIYMGRKSRESLITGSMLGFYPQSFHKEILELYEEKVKDFEKKEA